MIADGQSVAVLAHGLGGSTDLPVPVGYVLVGAAWVLTITFAVVAFAWRRPRFDPHKPGHPLPAVITRLVDSRVLRASVAALALLFTAWVVTAGLFGPQTSANALPQVFYILLWVGLVAVSLILGPVWRVLSPARSLYRLARRISFVRHGDSRWRYPHSWGYRPAAFGLFAFVWLELASPDSASMPAIKTWVLLYFVVLLVGGVAGGDLWLARVDPFEVYSVFVSRLSPFRRNLRTGAIVIGNPLDHLPSLPARPGAVAVVSVLFGSTAFDSFSASPDWRNFADRLSRSADVVPVTVASSV
ncbi:MAG: hypothetical protein JO152_05160, partial [Mycobacteriaceae bacterium]|nr:hypothetical protein [Mycobacteriaceae bacterium]